MLSIQFSTRFKECSVGHFYAYGVCVNLTLHNLEVTYLKTSFCKNFRHTDFTVLEFQDVHICLESIMLIIHSSWHILKQAKNSHLFDSWISSMIFICWFFADSSSNSSLWVWGNHTVDLIWHCAAPLAMTSVYLKPLNCHRP